MNRNDNSKPRRQPAPCCGSRSLPGAGQEAGIHRLTAAKDRGQHPQGQEKAKLPLLIIISDCQDRFFRTHMGPGPGYGASSTVPGLGAGGVWRAGE